MKEPRPWLALLNSLLSLVVVAGLNRPHNAVGETDSFDEKSIKQWTLKLTERPQRCRGQQQQRDRDGGVDGQRQRLRLRDDQIFFSPKPHASVFDCVELTLAGSEELVSSGAG
jgi:hypothetical protein